MFSIIRVFFLALSATISLPSAAHAYVGPGAGLGAIALVVALVVGVLLLLVGFLWYPLKRLLRSKKAGSNTKCVQR